jgi:hypothetical protein
MVNNASALAPALGRGNDFMKVAIAAVGVQAGVAGAVFAGPALLSGASNYLAFGASAGRAFYSGFGAATIAATAAGSYGGSTISTTPIGTVLQLGENALVSMGQDPDILRPAWNALSAPFAAGATGPVMMYSSWATGWGQAVIWATQEYPALVGNGTPIVWMQAGW